MHKLWKGVVCVGVALAEEAGPAAAVAMKVCLIGRGFGPGRGFPGRGAVSGRRPGWGWGRARWARCFSAGARLRGGKRCLNGGARREGKRGRCH